MAKITSFMLLLAVAFAGAMAAQGTTPSAAEESFRLMPKTVAPGTNNVAIRLEARSPDLFASESSRTPRLSFSTGVTLVANSFTLLSPSEAQATINVAADAASTVEVRLTVYSVDGKSALRQERGTLGISSKKKVTLGSTSSPNVSAGAVDLSAGDVKLVRVNVDDAQALGDIILDGNAAGDIVINPPTGTVFVTGMVPTVAVESGNAVIQVPRLDPGLGAFRFTILNNAYAATKVRVSNLMVDTSDFGRLGGTAGVLTTSVSGLGMGPGTTGGSAASLVANAHTAIAKLEGNAITDTGLTPEAPAPTTPPTTPTNPGTVNTPTGTNSNPLRNDSRREEDSRRMREEAEAQRRRDEWRNRQNMQPGQSGAQAPGGRPGGSFNPNRWSNPGFRSGEVARSDSGGASPAGGGSSGGASGTGGKSGPLTGGGFVRPSGGGDERPDSPVGEPESSGPTFFGEPLPSDNPADLEDYRSRKPIILRASPKLYFANQDWTPMSGVVLRQGVSGNQRSRVWVVLDRGEDISPNVDIVTISVRFGRILKQVTLTETGATTGVFRCDAAGIEVAAVGVHGEATRMN